MAGPKWISPNQAAALKTNINWTPQKRRWNTFCNTWKWPKVFCRFYISFECWRPFGCTRPGACQMTNVRCTRWRRASADKGADETDEVELQALCLTGEGVTLSVSCSMHGSDLRSLVSKNLSCKPGAKLVVHRGNGKLTLNEDSGDQGIFGKNAMLSCTYIPTESNWCVYSLAWLPVSSQIEREFVL